MELIKETMKDIPIVLSWFKTIIFGLAEAIGIPTWIFTAFLIGVALFVLYRIIKCFI